MCGDYFRKKPHGRELFVGVRLPQVFQHNVELKSYIKRDRTAAFTLHIGENYYRSVVLGLGKHSPRFGIVFFAFLPQRLKIRY